MQKRNVNHGGNFGEGNDSLSDIADITDIESMPSLLQKALKGLRDNEDFKIKIETALRRIEMEDYPPSRFSNRLSAILIYLYERLRIFFKYNRRTSLCSKSSGSGRL